MAGAGRSWMKRLALAVLLAGAGTLGYAQSAPAQSTPIQPVQSAFTGALSGRLTDLHSRPMDGATVVVRNQATGAESRTTTTKNGTYRFNGLEPGEYTLDAESPELGRGQVADIVVDAGHEARVQAAMEFEPLAADPRWTALVSANLLEAKQATLARSEIEAASAEVSSEEWAVEPLQTLPAVARRVVDVLGGMPAATTPMVNVTLATEPLQTLAVAPRNLRDSAQLPSAVSQTAKKIEIAREAPKKQTSGTETTAEKPEPEGGRGLNPRIRPAESARALAPEDRLSPTSAQIPHFSAACSAPEGRSSAIPLENHPSSTGSEARVDSTGADAGAAAPVGLS
ncbi:MAG: carboxypeptidase-like regulatory domain-containing protein, partial [Terracidiphilus sp.]